MNTVRSTLALFLVTTLGAGTAHAQAPLTRADVIAEFQDAARTGDLMAPGDSGKRLNELYPDRYRKAAPIAGMTRAQVVAELQSAVRSGEVLASGDSGKKENELFPQRYPAPAVVAAKTREQVRGETLEAIRLGDVVGAGETGVKLNEQFPRRYAGVLAHDAADGRAMAAAASAPSAGRVVQ